MNADGKPTVLAVHPGALGDVILLGHLLQQLGGTVTLLAGGEKARLLKGMGMVIAAMDFEALPMHEVFSDTPLDQCRLPAAVGAHDRLISCFAADGAVARERLAGLCGAGNSAFLPIRPPADGDAHLLDIWADMLGVTIDESPPPVIVPDAWRAAARHALEEQGLHATDPYVLIHPGAGSADKCWPLPGFLEFAESLEVPAVFVLGEAEVDGGRGIEMGASTRIVCRELSVLAGLAAEADGYVGNDSGPTHLAASVGAATVAIFGPTRVEHFAPRGPRVVTVAREALSKITVRDVRSALEDARANR